MSQGSPDSSHHAISVALFGILALTLGVRIGRFLYTPILPVLLSEGQFTFGQLSWIASANYAGYLAGSLLFSFGLFHLPSRSRPMLLTSALATAGLILAMTSFTQPALMMLIRFLAGVASAGMMIFSSMIVLHHTRHPFVIAALFSDVGAGILLGNEYVISGLHFAFSSHTLQLGAAAASAPFFVLLVMLLPSRDHVLPAAAPIRTEYQPMSWRLLAPLYGLAGFGYIIVATYLPLIAKSASSPPLTAHPWSLVGISVTPGCFTWLWVARHWGILQCLTANLLIQSTCVVMTFASGPLSLLVISCMGFDATFMGTTSLVMPLTRQLSVLRNINLLDLVTLTYGVGQILGPLLTSLLGSGAHTIVNTTVCGAVALFIAALISLTQLYKQRSASPRRV